MCAFKSHEFRVVLGKNLLENERRAPQTLLFRPETFRTFRDWTFHAKPGRSRCPGYGCAPAPP